jgi:hypothetical protein
LFNFKTVNSRNLLFLGAGGSPKQTISGNLKHVVNSIKPADIRRQSEMWLLSRLQLCCSSLQASVVGEHCAPTTCGILLRVLCLLISTSHAAVYDVTAFLCGAIKMQMPFIDGCLIRTFARLISTRKLISTWVCFMQVLVVVVNHAIAYQTFHRSFDEPIFKAD